MENLMDMEHTYLKMEEDTQESLRMELNMVQGSLIQLQVCIKVIFKMDIEMDLDALPIQIRINMKVNGKMINFMEMVKQMFLVSMFTLDNLTMV